ncbi:uncharacterized protein [Apostichopus japonicus]|uniref:uncharacterized protein n=1 Tax=Stichopus japonicus TaxID=307972 RepID=UPI003AB4DD51
MDVLKPSSYSVDYIPVGGHVNLSPSSSASVYTEFPPDKQLPWQHSSFEVDDNIQPLLDTFYQSIDSPLEPTPDEQLPWQHSSFEVDNSIQPLLEPFSQSIYPPSEPTPDEQLPWQHSSFEVDDKVQPLLESFPQSTYSPLELPDKNLPWQRSSSRVDRVALLRSSPSSGFSPFQSPQKQQLPPRPSEYSFQPLVTDYHDTSSPSPRFVHPQTAARVGQPSPIPIVIQGQVNVDSVSLAEKVSPFHDKDRDLLVPHGSTPPSIIDEDSGFESLIDSPLLSPDTPHIPSSTDSSQQTKSHFTGKPNIKEPLTPDMPNVTRRVSLGRECVSSPDTKVLSISPALSQQPRRHLTRNSYLKGPLPMQPLMTPPPNRPRKRKLESCEPTSVPFKRLKFGDQRTVTHFQTDLNSIFLSIRNIFNFNCRALTELGYEAEKDRCVMEMKRTSRSYSHNNLVSKDDRQDYSDWQPRWGYMFMYMMRHAHLVLHSLRAFYRGVNPAIPAEWNFPFDHNRLYSANFLQKCAQPGGVLHVCAIGGGPGSDLIGLALFLRANRYPVKIRAYILDLCGHWQRSWHSLVQQLPPYIAGCFLDVQYVPFNYLNPNLSLEQIRIISSADIITIVKSMSPVATKLSTVKPTRLMGSLHSDGMVKQTSIFNILSCVSSGSLVLYIDNRFGKQRRVMQESLQAAKGYSLLHYQVTKVDLPSTGFSPVSLNFMKWVGYGPSFWSGRNEVVVLARRFQFHF